MSVDPTTPPSAIELDEVLDVLTRGDLEIDGRLVAASNATLVASCTLPGATGSSAAHSPLRCVYKPVAGERPLWDFPDGSLGEREVAAYAVSAASGWEIVPPTVWREDGPFGPGMCQLWVETEQDEDLVDLVQPGDLPNGWLAVLEAFDGEGNPVVLAHADHPDLRRMAVFDIVVNNADRKGGHVLLAPDGAVRGVDHGVAFHVDPKLRTVLWGWSGSLLERPLLAEVEELRDTFDTSLGAELATLISPAEVTATRERLDALLAAPLFPAPPDGWPAIPWPAF